MKKGFSKRLLSLIMALSMLLTVASIAEADTTNLAKNMSVSVSSYHNSYPAADAVDGDEKTRWQATKETAWCVIDLSSEKTFDKIMINFINDKVASYKVVAADSAVEENGKVTLTGNVTLTEETSPTQGENVISFDKVTKRYIYFEETSVSGGRCGIVEFEVYDIALTSLSIADDYADIAIPKAAGETNTTASLAVSVTDEQGDTYTARNGDIVWTLVGEASGVSIDAVTGAVTVADSAAAGTITVRASLADDSSIYVDKALELFAVTEDGVAGLSYTNGYGTVTAPADGAEAVTFTNDVVAYDGNGEILKSDKYELSYVLNNGNEVQGISIDSATGAVTVADSALDGIYEVTAFAVGNEAVNVTMSLDVGVDITTAKDSINLAQGADVITVTSNHDSHPGENAVDGETKTRWQPLSKDTRPAISLDLGNVRYVNKIQIYATSSVGGTIKFEAADDNSFTTNLRTLCTDVIKKDGEWETFVFPTTRTRYVRASVTGLSGVLEMREMGIYRTKAVSVDGNDVEGMELFIPTEGSVTYTGAAACPSDASGAYINAPDFVRYSAIAEVEGVTLDSETGAITVASNATQSELKVTASLIADDSKAAEYTIYITDAKKQYTSSVNDDYALSEITLIDKNGEATTTISEATTISIEIMGVNPGKSNKVTAIVAIYEDASKSVVKTINLKDVDIKEFELDAYPISVEDIEGLVDGCVNIFLWNMETLAPIAEKLSY